MRYPKFLKDNDTIGILATSCGNNVNPYRIRAQVGIKKFSELGYKIKRGHRVFANYNATSAPHEIRASDFMSFYRNKNIDFLWSTGGGELMMGMLPYIDFEKIKKLPPKFFMGFSDNTNLTFTLTTICDVATIYGTSIGHFAHTPYSVDTIDAYKMMRNETLSYNSYPLYRGINSKVENKDPLSAPFYNDEVKWMSLSEKNETFSGRIIGGCLDVLVCLCGTKFDNVSNFIEKYKDDGIIWYFDNCELNSCGLYRALFQLKQAGWFKYVKGFLIGRNGSSFEPLGYTFKQALIDTLKEYEIDKLIKEAANRGCIISGISAGAIAIANSGLSDYQILNPTLIGMYPNKTRVCQYLW